MGDASEREEAGPVAGWVCTRCDAVFANGDVQAVCAGQMVAHVCPACGGRLKAAPSAGGDPAVPTASWWGLWCRNLAAPAAAPGIHVVWAGALVYWLLYQFGGLALRIPLVGVLFVLLLGLPFLGYLALWALETMANAATGDDSIAGWPEIGLGGGISEMWGGVWRCVLILGASFWPALAFLILGPDDAPLVLGVLVLLGLMLLPMAAIQVSLTQGLGLRAVSVLPRVIARAPGAYTSVVILLAASVGFVDFVAQPAATAIPIVGGYVLWFTRLWLLAVNARAIGLLFRYVAPRMAR